MRSSLVRHPLALPILALVTLALAAGPASAKLLLRHGLHGGGHAHMGGAGQTTLHHDRVQAGRLENGAGIGRHHGVLLP